MSRYKNMEEALKLINEKYISLNNQEVKDNNEIFHSTLSPLIEIMKQQDPLFGKLFERLFFGGSFYDGLKVEKPDEFDLSLLLVLPKRCEAHNTTNNCGCVSVTPSDKPGYFWFQVQTGYCAALDQFIKNGYIQTDLVLNWFKSKVTRALNKLSFVESGTRITFYSESGPALMLKLFGVFGSMNVNLVPAFKFNAEDWPQQRFRENETTKAEFFIVPKKPKAIYNYSEPYWRASFQEQERELINGKQRLKPTLRLLKKMRNNLVHSKISSYALKTIVLWEADTDFNWNETLSDVFMKLLEKYKECLYNQRISYYWNESNNLLDGINSETIRNHHNEIARLLNKIKGQHATDPSIVGKVILKEGTTEYKEFMSEYQQLNTRSNGLTVRSSNGGTPYCSFDPRISPGHPSEASGQMALEHPSSGWATAGGVILGVGAVAAVGFGIFSALNRNNRNQNN